MSLDKWVEHAWLKLEPTSPEEITGLQSIAERSIKDSKVDQISDDLRFYTAFNAVLALATIPLRASGYRVANQPGHHQRTIETLKFTLHSDDKLIRKLKAFSKRRNTVSYDSAGAISHQELHDILKVMEELKKTVDSWMKTTHPELLNRP